MGLFGGGGQGMIPPPGGPSYPAVMFELFLQALLKSLSNPLPHPMSFGAMPYPVSPPSVPPDLRPFEDEWIKGVAKDDFPNFPGVPERSY